MELPNALNSGGMELIIILLNLKILVFIFKSFIIQKYTYPINGGIKAPPKNSEIHSNITIVEKSFKKGIATPAQVDNTELIQHISRAFILINE